jgi:hypothetical protein
MITPFIEKNLLILAKKLSFIEAVKICQNGLIGNEAEFRRLDAGNHLKLLNADFSDC